MAENAPQKPQIAFEDFAKIDLRVAEITHAEPHPNADKLLKLQLDDGSGEPRQICAGIKQFYNPEDLVGKKIVIVANLAPRTIRGEESRGMLLAASDAPTLKDAMTQKEMRWRGRTAPCAGADSCNNRRANAGSCASQARRRNRTQSAPPPPSSGRGAANASTSSHCASHPWTLPFNTGPAGPDRRPLPCTTRTQPSPRSAASATNAFSASRASARVSPWRSISSSIRKRPRASSRSVRAAMPGRA